MPAFVSFFKKGAYQETGEGSRSANLSVPAANWGGTWHRFRIAGRLPRHRWVHSLRLSG